MEQENKMGTAPVGTRYLQIYLVLGIGTLGQMVFERMLISTGKTHGFVPQLLSASAIVVAAFQIWQPEPDISGVSGS